MHWHQRIGTVMLWAAVVLFVLWLGFSVYDMCVYQTADAFGSAPRYAYLLARLACFGLPAAGCLFLALLFKRRLPSGRKKKKRG